MLPDSLHLEIVTPGERLVTEVVDEVMLPGSEGSLGVLPGHAPLLTGLSIGEMMFRRSNVRRYLAIAWGFAEVLPGRVSILAEMAERAEKIDQARATAARDRALSRLRGRHPDTDFKRAQIALQKALIRIQVASHAQPDGSS